jgi:hypothetical protein
MELQLFTSALAAIFLAVVHILFPLFNRKTASWRHIWVPMSAGITIGYVFLYLLPKLTAYTQQIQQANPDAHELLQYWLYFSALIGLMVYQGAHRFSYTAEHRIHHGTWFRWFSFSTYSFIVGYLIATSPRVGALPFLIAAPIFAIHFLGVDHQLRERRSDLFDRYMRWVMAASVVAGWLIAVLIGLPKPLVFGMTAFMSGGMLANVMQDELPDHHKAGQSLPFASGVMLFVIAIIIMRSLPRVA